MDAEKIFSKLNSRDYNNKLEKILENKDFSENVKNLLLSMLYKIEVAYKDYAKVKRIVEDKKIYIEEVLEIIDKKCKKIVIVKEGTEEAEELEKENTKFLVDKLNGEIHLMYPNETLLLYTIYKIDDKQVYLEEKYNLIRVALSELLNAGENINNIEVVRDFNGWNWNTLNTEIPEIATNLIYQNLIYLLDINFIKEWIHTESVVDYLELVEEKLNKIYGKGNTDEILKQIYKISIIICTNKNEREKKRLLEEKEVLQKELARLKDKKSLLNEITNQKKDALKKIKQIDNILNDKELLEQEYIKRNEKRPEYNKIFSISHLTEILNKERKKLLTIIEEGNRLLEPKYYVEVTKGIEEQLELLESLDEKEKSTLNHIIRLQKAFIKCFNIKIKNANEKEQIVNFLYMLRYYNLLYITNKKQIKDALEIKQELMQMQEDLIKKAYELKVINTITNEEEANKKIMTEILTTKIISLENINIELKINDANLAINIYDGDIYEKTINIQEFDKKKIVIKLNKITKMFL